MAKCGEKTEIYSRVVGYFRPVADWNKGKREEFKERKTYLASSAVAKCKVA
ncbi:MAG: anaerobic ribonucleoside-triphosphate reductase [Victivallales bacterium]|nr:anaerobic ribonucleoside-triphosphate reductase [Victivallales bacterium]